MNHYLTKRQREVLDFVDQFILHKGYSPSIEEIGAGVGLSSPATVHTHLKNLEAKKLIRRGSNRSRAVEIVRPTRKGARRRVVALPLLGRVAAGEPIEAVEVREMVEVPEEFTRGRETFVLRVQGDSMIDEQIRDGDLVIVERRESADRGETVVALINGESATVKKFFPEDSGFVRLEPANSAMSAIIVPAKACQIQGVVIGLLRKY